MKLLNSSRLTYLSIILTLLLFSACSDDNPDAKTVDKPLPDKVYADLILSGAKIYTLNPEQPWAGAIAVKRGKILAVGNETELGRYRDSNTQVMTFAGGMVLPGFHDSHTHVAESGIEMSQCPLHELTSVEAILEKIKSCADKSNNGWVIGTGWSLTLFPPEGKADKNLLDEIVPDIPVYLDSIDGHSAWVNSRALQLADVNKDTPDPVNGVIERDPFSGEAIGTLRELAVNLVANIMPKPTIEQYEQAILFAISQHNRFGITSMVDSSVGDEYLQAYARLDLNNALNGRVITSMEYGTNFNTPVGSWDALTDKWKDYQGRQLRTRSIKLYLDGVLETETAALIEPYIGERHHHGILNFEANRLNEIVARFDADNFQVHMHAIGDAAVREGLDAIEFAQKQNGKKDNRHHISHLQLIHPEEITRFKQLDVTANFQALWAYPDEYIVNLNLPVVGQQRVDRMYPIGSIHKSGALITGGSDWTVSSLNPLDAIQVGVTREDPGGEAQGVLNPEEKVDLKTMIEAYTINGAWLMHQENVTGSIEAGKYADLVVLDKNLFELPVNEIHIAKVLHTFLQGNIVYSAE